MNKFFTLTIKTDSETVNISVHCTQGVDGITIKAWNGNPKSHALASAIDLAARQAPAIPQKPTQFWCGVLISHFLNQAAINYGKPVILQSVD